MGQGQCLDIFGGRAGGKFSKTWIFGDREFSFETWFLKYFYQEKKYGLGTIARDIFGGCFCFLYNPQYTNPQIPQIQRTKLTRKARTSIIFSYGLNVANLSKQTFDQLAQQFSMDIRAR